MPVHTCTVLQVQSAEYLDRVSTMHKEEGTAKNLMVLCISFKCGKPIAEVVGEETASAETKTHMQNMNKLLNGLPDDTIHLMYQQHGGEIPDIKGHKSNIMEVCNCFLSCALSCSPCPPPLPALCYWVLTIFVRDMSRVFVSLLL